MNCSEIRARLHAYVDGELTVGDIAEVDGHCMGCRECAALVSAEREFRELLRRQPRDAAPPELRARILRRVQRDAAFATGRRWLLLPAVAVAAAIVAAVLLPAGTPPPLVADLVDMHIAHAQIGQDHVEHLRGQAQQRLLSRAHLLHRVAGPPQHDTDATPHPHLVVDDENPRHRCQTLALSRATARGGGGRTVVASSGETAGSRHVKTAPEPAGEATAIVPP